MPSQALIDAMMAGQPAAPANRPEQSRLLLSMLPGNAPTLSSEEEALRNMSPVDALKFSRDLQNRRQYSPDEAAANRAQTAEDLAYVTPVLGNALSARDAYRYGREAATTPDETDAHKNMAMAGLSTLGAITGLPFGRTAAQVAREGPDVLRSLGGPMDEASRIARAKAMGYADEPFYRGEASGKPYEGGPAHFSRDPETAGGFAEKGGQSGANEYRLNLSQTFSDAGRLTAADFGKLLHAASERDPHLAQDLAETVAPGKGVDWLLGFAKAKPDFVVVEKGGAPFIRQAIERGSSDPIGLFRSAGYDALDSGRDVRKIGAEGIRSKDARFDPSKASSTDIMATLAGASLLPAWMISQGSTSRRD